MDMNRERIRPTERTRGGGVFVSLGNCVETWNVCVCVCVY